MPNYAEGKIYILTSKMTELVYVGSTCKTLSRRLNGHKGAYQGYLKGTRCYVSSFEIVKHDDCKIELIDECPCTSREELRQIEQSYIDEWADGCINKRNAIVDRKEYKKQYDLEHKDKIKARKICHLIANAAESTQKYIEHNTRNRKNTSNMNKTSN
jgi:hypothetical protein